MISVFIVLLLFGGITSTISNVAAQEVVSPKELTVVRCEGYEGPAAHFNPVTYWNIAPMSTQVMYESLAYFDELSNQFKPWLAQEWGWIEDDTFEIALRPEAHWRDGTSVTADDVVFSLTTHGDSRYSGALTPIFEIIESMTAIDDCTIRVVVAEGYERYLRVESSLLNIIIFQKARWSGLMEEYEDITEYPNFDFDQVVASGPYTIVSSDPEKDRYARVDDWWGELIGWHCAPKYFIQLYAGSDAKSDELWQSGVQNIAQTVVSENFDEVVLADPFKGCWDRDAESIALMLGGTNIHYNLIPNLNDPLLKERWLRLALAYAIDYDHMGPACIPSYLPATPSLIHPLGAIGYVDGEIVTESFETELLAGGIPQIKYDPDKAVEILGEHCEGSVEKGWTYDGQPLGPWEIIAVAGWGDSMTQAEMTSTYWAELGIELNPVFLTYGVWEARAKAFDYDWYCGYNGISPGFAAAASQLTNLLTISSEAGWSVWSTPTTFPDFFPEEAAQIQPLVDQLWHLPYGSSESIEIAKQIQEIYVPLLYFIPCFASSNWIRWTTTEWVNFPTKTHPYENSLSGTGPWMFPMLKNMKSRFIETSDFSLSKTEIEPGETVIASVTLKNIGKYPHDHIVQITMGSAQMPPSSPIAWQIVTVPAGETLTAIIPLEFEELGEYKLTVDNWRVGDTVNEPGDPISVTLTVGEVGPSPIEELATKVDELANQIQDIASDTESAKTAAEEAQTLASEAMVAAQATTTMPMVYASIGVAIVAMVIALYAAIAKK